MRSGGATLQAFPGAVRCAGVCATGTAGSGCVRATSGWVSEATRGMACRRTDLAGQAAQARRRLGESAPVHRRRLPVATAQPARRTDAVAARAGRADLIAAGAAPGRARTAREHRALQPPLAGIFA